MAAPVDLLRFTPVPLARVTARGWSAMVQIAFIDALSRCGVVVAAAGSVGRTARSAYILRSRVGANGFAAAWDIALRLGQQDAHAAILEDCFHPRPVPIVRRGRVIGTQTKMNAILALAAVRARRTPPSKLRSPPPDPLLFLEEIEAIWGPKRPLGEPHRPPEICIRGGKFDLA